MSLSDKSKPFTHPSFINEDIEKKRVSNPVDQATPIKSKPPTIHHEDSEASMINNNLNTSPVKPQESLKPNRHRMSSGSSFEEKKTFAQLIGECLGLRRMKSLKMKAAFGMGATQEYDKRFIRNYVSTTKYNLMTWFPKSLMIQFLRIANIYFLIITILTAMPFSPKMPQTMFLTFSTVLFVTMIKEGYEDYQRYKLDKEVNKKTALVFDYESQSFMPCLWQDVKMGDVLKVKKDESFPCDLLMVRCSSENGIAFIDTMNLDGETNLKEKIVLKEFQELEEKTLFNLKGVIECDSPNEFLDRFEGNITANDLNLKRSVVAEIKQLLLRGSVLKNTDWIVGIAVYCGHNTKSFQNSRKPPAKMSNVLRKMNKVLYSVFFMQAMICLVLSIISVIWENKNASSNFYLDLTSSISFGTFIERFFVFLVAFSQLIPISLYVALEVLKLIQGYLISNDEKIFYQPLNKKTCVRSSELIEELGQIEFIFSDKTGTLTCNCMEFRKCSINGVVYDEDLNTQIESKEGRKRPSIFLKSQDNNIEAFFRFIGLCHTVVTDNNSGTIKYQASSPDELALVEGAAKIGYKLINKSSNFLTLQIQNKEPEKWYTLIEFPFDSTRKRMSMVVRNAATGQYLLLTKGADSSMLPKIRQDEIGVYKVEEHLKEFSLLGLRTLVMGQKELSQKEYEDLSYEYESIRLSKDRGKDKKLNKLYENYERNLDLVGCSAIEDKLQDGVPETIQKLIEAEIKLWVLTGDKQETAIEIGKSCRLIQQDMDLVVLSSNNAEDFSSKLKRYINTYEIKPFAKGKSLASARIKGNKKISIVIDGQTLIYVLNTKDKEIEELFFQLAIVAHSCICCRVSPKQKADIVKLAKSRGKWLTLAIGDGANDVAMIMEAHVGVGVYGKEGTQAARISDFAIGQFEYLQRLLFLHGRWGYKRIGTFICYYFYKNCVMVLPEILFAFCNGFSGQIYFLDWLPLLFNAFWTSWPCMINYSLDQDVNAVSSMKYPKLYRAGPLEVYFNFRRFWGWLLFSFIHGSFAFGVPVLCFDCAFNRDGIMPIHWLVSTTSFCIVMHTITIKLFLETSFHTAYNLFFGFFSLIVYYVTLFILASPGFAKMLQPQFNSMMGQLMSVLKFWIVILLVPGAAVLPDLFYTFWKRKVRLNPKDMVLSLQK